jgi:F420H(2)-dependent quinone reductase
MTVTDQILQIHERIYERSDGRVGHKMIGVPTLLLRTTGRRSGQTRTNGLVYARDGQDYIVVPSNGGSDKSPGWLLNLRDNPEVEIQVGRERKKATGRVVEFADPEFPRLFQIANENNRWRYTNYQQQTARQIPVVVLTPR